MNERQLRHAMAALNLTPLRAGNLLGCSDSRIKHCLDQRHHSQLSRGEALALTLLIERGWEYGDPLPRTYEIQRGADGRRLVRQDRATRVR